MFAPTLRVESNEDKGGEKDGNSDSEADSADDEVLLFCETIDVGLEDVAATVKELEASNAGADVMNEENDSVLESVTALVTQNSML